MRLLSVSRSTTSLLTDCPYLLGATMPPALPCCTRCCRSIVLKYVGTLMCIAPPPITFFPASHSTVVQSPPFFSLTTMSASAEQIAHTVFGPPWPPHFH